jgi:ankyrin repeat protein
VTAASKGHRSVVEFLLSLPAIDIFARNLQNETAYDIAAERGDITIYEEIEAHERHVWMTKNPNSKSRLSLHFNVSQDHTIASPFIT